MQGIGRNARPTPCRTTLTQGSRAIPGQKIGWLSLLVLFRYLYTLPHAYRLPKPQTAVFRSHRLPSRHTNRLRIHCLYTYHLYTHRLTAAAFGISLGLLPAHCLPSLNIHRLPSSSLTAHGTTFSTYQILREYRLP